MEGAAIQDRHFAAQLRQEPVYQMAEFFFLLRAFRLDREDKVRRYAELHNRHLEELQADRTKMRRLGLSPTRVQKGKFSPDSNPKLVENYRSGDGAIDQSDLSRLLIEVMSPETCRKTAVTLTEAGYLERRRSPYQSVLVRSTGALERIFAGAYATCAPPSRPWPERWIRMTTIATTKQQARAANRWADARSRETPAAPAPDSPDEANDPNGAPHSTNGMRCGTRRAAVARHRRGPRRTHECPCRSGRQVRRSADGRQPRSRTARRKSPAVLREVLDRLRSPAPEPSSSRSLVQDPPKPATHAETAVLAENPDLSEYYRESPEAALDLLRLIREAAKKQ